MTLEPSGQLDGHVEGKIRIANADIARDGLFGVALDDGDVALDVRFSSGSAEVLSVVGRIAASFGPARVQVVTEGQRFSVDQGVGGLDGLELTSTPQALALALAAAIDLNGGAAALPRGDIDIATARVNLGSLRLEIDSDLLTLALASSAETSDLSALVHARDALPEVRLALGGSRSTVENGARRAGPDVLEWRAVGDFAADGFAGSIATEAGSVQVRRAEIAELEVDQSGLLASSAVTIDGLVVDVDGTLLGPLLGARGEPASAPTNARSTRPAMDVDIRHLQGLLTDLGYAPGPVDDRMGPKTAGAILAFQAQAGLPLDGRATSGLLAALGARAQPVAPAPAPLALSKDGSVPQAGSLRVSALTLTGSPSLRYRDGQGRSPLSIDATVSRFEVRNLHIPAGDQPMELSLGVEINGRTGLKLSGWVNDLTPYADLDLKVALDDLQLPSCSRWIETFAGLPIDAGRLDATATIQANAGELGGKLGLAIAGLVLSEIGEADAQRASGTVGFPVRTAIGLLEDAEGRIELDLPLRGTVREPDLDISSAIGKPVGGALTKVFPPTMIASLLASLTDADGPNLAPIGFAPASSVLDRAGRAYADDLAELLALRPDVSLKLCGRATASDASRMSRSPEGAADRRSRRLAELAAARAEAVLRYLIQENAVDSKHVNDCRPVFDPSDQGPPRVEVLL